MLNQFRYSAGKFRVSFHVFDIQGNDASSFLQNQSTFDSRNISPHSFHMVSFLDPQGRAEVYGWLLNNNDSYSFLVPEQLKEAAEERLNRYLISEDVTISGPSWKEWTLALGPEADPNDSSYAGVMFTEKAFLSLKDSWDYPIVEEDDIDLWMGLTGWPSFDGSNFKKELITNLNLYYLSVSSNKGCYPGQETVSKISTRRGAALSPVLIELDEKSEIGPITNFDKKIGEGFQVYTWDGKYYLLAKLLRDFRIEGMIIQFKINEKKHNGIVRYLPFLSGANEEKSQELYYEALEFFKKDNYQSSEECFKLSIKLDPTFADSYEGLGVLLGRLERFDEAITWMQQLVEIDPKSVLAHTNMSLFLMRLGKIDEAEEQKSLATIKSFAKFGEEAKVKELEESSKIAKMNEWKQRESMFRQVLEIDPEDTLANYGLGSIAVERSEWETAIIHLENVVKADPAYSVAYLALGKALKGLGRKSEAREVWQKGIRLAANKGDLMPANQMQTELENLKP